MPWFGVFGTIDHEVPFQVSARLAGEGPEVAAAEPTALHVVALKQSTPVSLLFDVAEVSGTVAVIAHCVPFQLSIRFWERGPVRLTWPTAWQKDTPAHDTELNVLPRPAVGWGVVWSVHAVPFHSSLKDDPGADGVVSPFPTAMHQLAVTQSMPVALGRGVPDVTVGWPRWSPPGWCRSTGSRRWSSCQRLLRCRGSRTSWRQRRTPTRGM